MTIMTRRSVLISLAALPLALLLSACAGTPVVETNRIDTCNRPAIKQAMQRLYDKSPIATKSITQLIDPLAFEETCSGAFKARTPIMGWGIQSRYPEISIGWNVSYSINRNTGVCIRRAATLESAGVYENCHR